MPKDIAVIGIDNDVVICENTIPALASVAPNFEQAGYLAAELLSRRFADPNMKPTTSTLSTGVCILPQASLTSSMWSRVVAM